jgi:lysozyme
MPDIAMTPGDKRPGRYRKTTLSLAMVALIAAGKPAIDLYDQFSYEKEGSRTTAYPDGSRGVWTICKGLTHYQGKPVYRGLKLTPDECRIADRAELESDLRAAREVLGEAAWGRASEPMKVSVADMIHTLGKERVRHSTAVLDLRAGRINEGCAAMTLWIRDVGRDCRKAGSDCQGQPIRRMQEDELCLTGDAP